MDSGNESLERLFAAALQFNDPARRAAFLDGACGAGSHLRQRVGTLLRDYEQAGQFLEEPPAGVAGDKLRAPTETEKPGAKVGRYKLLEKIGEGGCGVVYVAEQEEPVHRRVALKVIKLGMDTEQVVARFEAERQALALMDHPNIAKVLDAGATEAGRPYFVMELVRGVKITEYCDQNNLSTQERLDLFILVCHAIQHAHQKGIIHRDIKPSNLLVTINDGVPVPKVIDFGIAKATLGRLTEQTIYTPFDQFIGTPAYMSPEQAMMTSQDIDTRSDIYSLGVLLYELLTGCTPFDAAILVKSGLDQMRRVIREQEPQRPSTRLSTLDHADLTAVANHRRAEPLKLANLIRGDLDWIAMKCLEKDRTRRFETVSALAADITRYLHNEPVIARPPSRFYQLRKLVKRNKFTFAAVGAVAAALILGLGLSTWLFLKEKKARERAVAAEFTQAALRQRAEVNEKKAQREAKRAAVATAEVEMTLAASDFLQSVRFAAEDDASQAVPYLVRSLSANQANEAAVTRLTTLLAYHPWMVPVVSFRHNGAVMSARLSPDGTRLVTASYDNTARVWDAQTGHPVTEPLKHADKVMTAEFSLDGKRIATGSQDGTARVWDVESGQQLIEPLNHGGSVTSVQFSPDGKRVLTAGAIARVWDAQTGKPLTEPLKHGGAFVNLARFSSDGNRIITAAEDSTARIWDAQTGKPLSEPLKHGSYVVSAQFSPDGNRVVTGSWDSTARVWDAWSGRPLGIPLEHAGSVKPQFSPDGRRIVTASYDTTARVWDADSGRPMTEPLKHSAIVMWAEFSPDGKHIVTASGDNTARIWDAQTGKPLTEPLAHGWRVRMAQFKLDGRRILTASEDGFARIWELQSGPPLTEILKHSDQAVSAEFNSQGDRVLTASADGTARVWDARSGRPLTEPLRHGSYVNSAQFSPDDRRIVTASSDTTARVWDAENGQPLTEPLRHGGAVMSAQFSSDGKRIVTASGDNTARVWDAQTGQPVTEPIKPGGILRLVQFSPDGKRILTFSGDNIIHVWDVQTGKKINIPFEQKGYLMSAEFSPDGKKIVTGSAANLARVWDSQTGQPTVTLRSSDTVLAARFSPDSGRILMASRDGSARVYDVEGGQPLTGPLKHGSQLNLAQFSPDGTQILTASFDGTARVWDVQSGQPLTEPLKHEARLNSAQFSPDGKRVLTAWGDGTVRIWGLAPAKEKAPDWLLKLAEAVSGKVLNKQGLLEPTALNRVEVLDQIRQKLKNEPNVTDWVIWGRWFLTDPSIRTITPFSTITVPDYIENRIKENTSESLNVAERLATGNPGLLRRISKALRALNEADGTNAVSESGLRRAQESK